MLPRASPSMMAWISSRIPGPRVGESLPGADPHGAGRLTGAHRLHDFLGAIGLANLHHLDVGDERVLIGDLDQTAATLPTLGSDLVHRFLDAFSGQTIPLLLGPGDGEAQQLAQRVTVARV